MKACFPFLCCLGLLLSTGCATPVIQTSYVPPPPGPPDELEQLVAPIALYPDPLVALLLPASTVSTDIVLAARYLESGGDPTAVENQPWDDSVRALAHYPELVHWLNENLAWTRQLGDAYYDQPEAVMAAIQRARARALANGTLVNTSQQEVVVQDGHILILPAQPDLIYVPRYDPAIIYLPRAPGYYSGTWIRFGMGFGVGWWLGYHCDWGHHTIWFDQHRRDHWRDRRDWNHHDRIPRPGHTPPEGWQPWKPRTDRDHHRPDRGRPDVPRHPAPRPRPFAGTPSFPPRHPNMESPREHHEPAPRTPRQPVVPEPEHRAPPPVMPPPAAPESVATQPLPPPTRNRSRMEPRPEPRPEPRDYSRRGPEGNRRANLTPAPAPSSAPNRVAPRPAPRLERPNPPNRQVGSPAPSARPVPPPQLGPSRPAPKPPPPRSDPGDNDKDKNKDR